ncbi:MAG: hypothetical protein BGO99_13840 [Nitrosospira sp. 56-18]|nr:hypothetical protein [Nitrosospira sp.]OJY12452.1 MAG: hypothetical protein BGO99_13840 [Nitrosospira sp. 56-18]
MTDPKKPNRGGEVSFRSLNRFKKENGQLVCTVTAKFVPVTEEIRQLQAEQRAKFDELRRKIEACPDSDGWIRLCEILEDSTDDERVKSSKGASEFLELMLELSQDAIFAPSVDVAIAPLKAALRSDHGKDMAQKRHEKDLEIKKWIREEWVIHKTKYRNNKTTFANAYVKRILEKFGVKRSSRTIREDWLKEI